MASVLPWQDLTRKKGFNQCGDLMIENYFCKFHISSSSSTDFALNAHTSNFFNFHPTFTSLTLLRTTMLCNLVHWKLVTDSFGLLVFSRRFLWEKCPTISVGFDFFNLEFTKSKSGTSEEWSTFSREDTFKTLKYT